MPAGNQGEALVRVVEQLCAELPVAEEIPGATSTLWEKDAAGGFLGAGDDALVAQLRVGLATIAAAFGNRPESPSREVEAALDGAELVIRGQIAIDGVEQLPRLLPSLVFLVALPVAGQDQALELSRRTNRLIDEERERRDSNPRPPA